MKKIFISLFAVAALAACTKSEVQYDEPSAISFAPVAQNLTKTVVTDGTFPTGQDLYVFANASADNSTWSEPYFKNALFEHATNLGETENPAGAYKGNPERYWPNVKSLKFAGYSQACNTPTLASSATVPTMDFTNNQLKISGYIQNNTASGQGNNDLMWFPMTTQYTKQSKEVPVTMKHACSWITINVAGDQTTGATNTTWKVTGLKITGLTTKGNVTCGEASATWDFTNVEETYKNQAEAVFTGTQQLTTTHTECATTAANTIVLPQTPTNLEVTYQYVSQAGNTTDSDTTNNDDIVITETATVPLTLGENVTWVSGTHYTYNITITATQILIDPVVEKWVEYDTDTTTQNVENPSATI